jgi:hypothetical protein
MLPDSLERKDVTPGQCGVHRLNVAKDAGSMSIPVSQDRIDGGRNGGQLEQGASELPCSIKVWRNISHDNYQQTVPDV